MSVVTKSSKLSFMLFSSKSSHMASDSFLPLALARMPLHCIEGVFLTALFGPGRPILYRYQIYCDRSLEFPDLFIAFLAHIQGCISAVAICTSNRLASFAVSGARTMLQIGGERNELDLVHPCLCSVPQGIHRSS